jgi:uncharacterized protein (TIGR02147 family)
MRSAHEFLNHEFQRRKEKNPNFSLRAFAKWLNISPAQLSQMLAGKRPVTLNSLKKIVVRVGLSPGETKTLMNSLLAEKSFIESPRQKLARNLKNDQFCLIADWYHFAILSLTRTAGAKADPRWVARRLGISIVQAHKALLLMERLGILQTKPEFKQVGELLDVVSEIPSEAIQKYHKQNLNLAAEKIEMVPLALRQFQSISIPTHPKHLAKLKVLIDEFLENASDIAESSASTEVYNLNVQLFPVTKIKE